MSIAPSAPSWPFPVKKPQAGDDSGNNWPLPLKHAVNAALTQPVAQPAQKCMGRKRWNDSDLVVFAELHVTGSSSDEIAKKLSRSPKSVTNQLSDAACLKTKTGRKLSKLIIEKRNALAALKASQAQPVNHRASWGASEDKQLLMLFISNETPEAIAKACGRTVHAIAGRLHALGVLVFNKDELTYMTAPRVWLKVSP